MRFTTLSFLVFFLVFYLVYWSMRGRPRLGLVFVSSVLFYAVWSVGFAVHFVAMVAFSYGIVQWMRRTKSSLPFYAGVIVNLGNLFFFKYFYLLLQILFDTTNLSLFERPVFDAWLLGSTGYPSIVLPLAISFYTFVLVAYIFDVHRGLIQEKHTFLEFAVFAMYFPHLVAGPIIRHSDFFPQLEKIDVDAEKITRGMFLILLGLIKKVAIADNMLPLFSAMFQQPESFSGAANLLAAAGFSIWVYCDFSGYTDLARGMSLLLGIELPENFRAPFLARSVRELWRDWHATLGTWMRDYVFIPLGGSRQGELRSNVNLIITFTLGGLWHGAHYPYVVWGFFHGLMLVIERRLGQIADRLGWFQRAPRGLERPVVVARVIIVFCIFMIGAVFFNSPTVKSAFVFLGSVFTWADGAGNASAEKIIYFSVAGYVLNFLQLPRSAPGLSTRTRLGLLFAFGCLVVFLLGKYPPGGRDFLYFQF
jgi:alginate O-acetyltransferase complex protein AlgI